jgi:hypothetical protein
MNSERSKIKKLMLISPEYYNKLLKLRQKNIDYENQTPSAAVFKNILNDPKLTQTQKLIILNNIYNIALNSLNNQTVRLNPNKTMSSENLNPKLSNTNHSYTDLQIVDEQKPNLPFIDSYEASHYETSTPIKNDSNELFHPKSDIVKDIYADDSKEVDLSNEKKIFVNEIKEQLRNDDINLNDLSIRQLDDPSKSFAIVRNRVDDDVALVEKPNVVVSRKRQQQSNKKSSIDKASKLTKKRLDFSNLQTVKKLKTRKQKQDIRDVIQDDLNNPTHNFISQWTSYSSDRLSKKQ